VDDTVRILQELLSRVSDCATKKDLAMLHGEVTRLTERWETFRDRCENRHQSLTDTIASVVSKQAHLNGRTEATERGTDLGLHSSYVTWTKIGVIVAVSAALVSLIVSEIVKKI